MDKITQVLTAMGEDFEVVDKEIKVKLSWLLGGLSITHDIAKNKPAYHYRQHNDLLFATLLMCMSLLSTQSAISTLCIAIALLKFTLSIIKEIRVTAIKSEIVRALSAE